MLTRIVNLESLGKKPLYAKSKIAEIAENCSGDIRSAIYSLQFSGYHNGSTEMVNCKRENQLSLFQVVGKVLYNKSMQRLN